MVDGCRIRELPDGGREFVLEEPGLSFIRIDEQSRLQFGRTEVVIASPFVLELTGTVHFLDPHRHDALGPLVALYPSRGALAVDLARRRDDRSVRHRRHAPGPPRSDRTGLVGRRQRLVPARPLRPARPGRPPRAARGGGRPPSAASRRARRPWCAPTRRASGSRSIWTLSMVSAVGANRTGTPVSSERYPHHSSMLTASSPPQLTVVAGVEAAPSRPAPWRRCRPGGWGGRRSGRHGGPGCRCR